MCFSATASFTAAGVTAAIGVATLAKVRNGREAPLAAFPLLFAGQQAVEGLIWLNLGEASETYRSGALVSAFLAFAEVLWPVLVPVAVLAVEPRRATRIVLAGLVGVAVAVSGYLLYAMVSAPYEVTIQGSSLHYSHKFPGTPGGRVLYAACTTLPLLLSSHRYVKLMGVLVMLGLVASQWFYAHAFLSVWCFFAAAASVTLYLHFSRNPYASRQPETAR